jgi:Flp pilus assembly pilin Flp
MTAIERHLTHFWRDTSGAITVEWTVLTAGMVAIALAATSVVGSGLDTNTAMLSAEFTREYRSYEARNFGRSPLEVAQELEMEIMSSARRDRRVEQLLNALTDNQLRNQHRTWNTRAANPDYDRLPLARDQVALIDVVMDARKVDPHANVPTPPSV